MLNQLLGGGRSYKFDSDYTCDSKMRDFPPSETLTLKRVEVEIRSIRKVHCDSYTVE